MRAETVKALQSPDVQGYDGASWALTLGEDEERAWLRENEETLRAAYRPALEGFFGPSSSCTSRTPDLLAELGFLYHCDWMHDDQPTPLKVQAGRLISVPYTMETNDGPVLRASGDQRYFARICKAQFDRLYREGAESGRVMCLAIHPCWTGQPHRIRYLDEVARLRPVARRRVAGDGGRDRRITTTRTATSARWRTLAAAIR